MIKPNYSYSFKARIMIKPNKNINKTDKFVKDRYIPVRNNIFSKIIKYFLKKQMKIQLKDPS